MVITVGSLLFGCLLLYHWLAHYWLFVVIVVFVICSYCYLVITVGCLFVVCFVCSCTIGQLTIGCLFLSSFLTVEWPPTVRVQPREREEELK